MEQNKYKNSMGRRYLRSLFYEEAPEDKTSVVYTLKRDDHLGYPSLYRLYMEVGDITEYKFACLHLDGWSHWKELCSSDWFKPYIAEWRDELETKIRSDALASIVSLSQASSNPNAFPANKYLLEALRSPAGASKRGRPRGDEVRAEIKRQAALSGQIDDDAKRIGLN